MANFNFTISPQSEGGNYLDVFPSDRVTIVPGDTVSIRRSGGTSATVTVIYPAGVFTDSNSTTHSNSTYQVKTVRSSPALGNSSAGASSPGYSGASILFNVESGADTTPDAFNLGSNRTNANPGTEYQALEFEVTGITVPTNISITNGSFSVQYQPYRTSSTTVTNGQLIRVLYNSPSGYSQSRTVTLTIGTVSDSLTVTTKASPDSGQTLSAPFTSLPVRNARDIAGFFGRDDSGNPRLSHYVRGGDFVPNIAANSGVPTSTPLRTSHFLNSATSIYFETPPGTKVDEEDTTAEAKDLSVRWVMDTDWFVGFGDGMKNVAQFRYTVNVQTWPDGRSSSDVQVSTPDQPNNAYSNANREIILSVNAPRYSEGQFTGEVTFYMRHPSFASQVTTHTTTFRLSYYGP